MSQNEMPGANALPASEVSTILGEAAAHTVFGDVTCHVYRLRLKQFDKAKGIIAQVLTSASVQKSISTPDGPVTFTDQDLVKGFMETENLIPQFLELVVKIEPTGKVDLGDLSMEAAMILLNQALEVNQGFFDQCLAMLGAVVGKVSQLQTKVEALTMPLRAVPTLPIIPDGAPDLTQANKPLGERSPQLFSPS